MPMAHLTRSAASFARLFPVAQTFLPPARVASVPRPSACSTSPAALSLSAPTPMRSIRSAPCGAGLDIAILLLHGAARRWRAGCGARYRSHGVCLAGRGFSVPADRGCLEGRILPSSIPLPLGIGENIALDVYGCQRRSGFYSQGENLNLCYEA